MIRSIAYCYRKGGYIYVLRHEIDSLSGKQLPELSFAPSPDNGRAITHHHVVSVIMTQGSGRQGQA